MSDSAGRVQSLCVVCDKPFTAADVKVQVPLLAYGSRIGPAHRKCLPERVMSA